MHQRLHLQQLPVPRSEIDIIRLDLFMVDLAIHPLRRILQPSLSLPAINDILDLERQEHLTRRLEPLWLDDEGEHDARRIRPVRPTSMPEPDIADDQTAFLRRRLDGRRVFASFFDQSRLDRQPGLAGVQRVLVDAAVSVAAGPDLRRAVLGRDVAERDVDDHGEGEQGMRLVDVGVHRLPAGGFEGGVACNRASVEIVDRYE